MELSKHIVKQLFDHFKEPNQNQLHWLRRYIRYIELCFDLPIREHILYEVHHIVPRSWGGSNKKENMIALPVKHHIVAHHILSRTKDLSMIRAFGACVFTNAAKDLFSTNVLINMIAEARQGLGRPVINLDTGQIFSTVTYAANSIGVYDTAISNSIDGQTRSGGYFWQYLDVFEASGLTRQQEIEIRNTKIKQSRLNNSGRSRTVVNLNTGEEFPSCNSVLRYYFGPDVDIKNSASLTQMIKHKHKLAGYYWQYKDVLEAKNITYQQELENYQQVLKEREEQERKRHGRPVKELYSGKEFASVKDAARHFNMHTETIRRAITANRETLGKKFMYIKDQ